MHTAPKHPLTAHIKPNITPDGLPPSHHVLAPAPGTILSSYLPHWNAQPATPVLPQDDDDDGAQGLACLPNSIALVDSHRVVRTGFRNPWPSWHKPTVAEVWQGLEWGEDHDAAIEWAMRHVDLSGDGDSGQGEDAYKDSRPGTPDLEDVANDTSSSAPSTNWFTSIPSAAPSYTRQQRIKLASKQLLTIQPPAFEFSPDKRLKATWLGHAGVLVQLPPLSVGGEPVRVLFDPIFSQRCSPTQIAGPVRTYAAPCAVESLPPIDVVIISHNHYDHLDYDTICSVWRENSDRVRFVVPLGNKEWFVGAHANDQRLQPTTTSTSSLTTATTSNLSIPPERVTELDWWDEVLLSAPGSDKALRVVCTPAQHGSGRYGLDANCALWASWFLEHPGHASEPTKIFFGGDTGCQFHRGAFPPPPPSHTAATPTSETSDDTPVYRGGTPLSPSDSEGYPPCPAFDEIVTRLGTPTLLMLPISVGATISFLRSYVPLPDSVSPFPRISAGLTAANHMPPWDAVRVFDKMTEGGKGVCMAIHWGTFISGPEEVLKSLGQLEWACERFAVEFARDGEVRGKGKGKTFVALNHGASITL